MNFTAIVLYVFAFVMAVKTVDIVYYDWTLKRRRLTPLLILYGFMSILFVILAEAVSRGEI